MPPLQAASSTGSWGKRKGVLERSGRLLRTGFLLAVLTLAGDTEIIEQQAVVFFVDPSSPMWGR